MRFLTLLAVLLLAETAAAEPGPRAILTEGGGTVMWLAPETAPRHYGVEIEITPANGDPMAVLSIDTVTSDTWVVFPCAQGDTVRSRVKVDPHLSWPWSDWSTASQCFNGPYNPDCNDDGIIGGTDFGCYISVYTSSTAQGVVRWLLGE